MPLLAALWLALVHALLAAPLRSPHGEQGEPRARVERASERPGGPARWIAADHSDARAAALPASRVAATPTPARSAPPGPIGGTPATALQPESAPSGATEAARRTLARHGTDAHVRAARGGLLPYYPTAPPVPG